MFVSRSLLVLTALAAIPAAQEPSTQPATLTVDADASVRVTPDRATVRLGAEMQADTAQKAQERVNQVMQQAIAAIERLGIAADDIRTASISLSPVYSQPGGDAGGEAEPRVIAYRASQTLQVTVNTVGSVGQVIDTGMGAGLNRVEDLWFGVSDPTPARLQALRDAVTKARREAEVLAEAAGQRLVSVRSVQQTGRATPSPRMESLARGFAAATPVQPGQLEITASVTVRYRIEPRDRTVK